MQLRFLTKKFDHDADHTKPQHAVLQRDLRAARYKCAATHVSNVALCTLLAVAVKSRTKAQKQPTRSFQLLRQLPSHVCNVFRVFLPSDV
jgi:hypothetical protein